MIIYFWEVVVSFNLFCWNEILIEFSKFCLSETSSSGLVKYDSCRFSGFVVWQKYFKFLIFLKIIWRTVVMKICTITLINQRKIPSLIETLTLNCWYKDRFWNIEIPVCVFIIFYLFLVVVLGFWYISDLSLVAAFMWRQWIFTSIETWFTFCSMWNTEGLCLFMKWDY